MISKETENVQSYEEIENAFRAITASSERPYVTKDELYSVSCFLHFLISLLTLKLYLFLFAEPHKRNGRLLRAAYETVHRSKIWSCHLRRFRLRRFHQKAF